MKILSPKMVMLIVNHQMIYHSHHHFLVMDWSWGVSKFADLCDLVTPIGDALSV